MSEDVHRRQSQARDHVHRRLEREASGEHRQSPEDGALALGQELVAPVERGPERLLARQRGPVAAGEQREAVVEAGRDAECAERRHPCGGELDGERDAVQAPADGRDGRRHAVIWQEPRLRGVRPCHEQPDRIVPQHLLHVRVLGGHRQRRHAVHVLAGGAQRLAAGAQHGRAGTGAEDGLGETGGRIDEVLAVVEEQQEPLRTDGGADTVGRDAGAGQRQTEHGGHRHRNEIGCRERGELGEEDPVGKRREAGGGRPPARGASCRSPGPGQGDQPMVRHEGRGLTDLDVSADQLRNGGREVADR